jgi:hypothetical protein
MTSYGVVKFSDKGHLDVFVIEFLQRESLQDFYSHSVKLKLTILAM